MGTAFSDDLLLLNTAARIVASDKASNISSIQIITAGFEMSDLKIRPPKTASERLDLSFGIFARRGEKYSCYTLVLKFVPSAGGVCGAATNAVGEDAGYGLLE